MVTEALYTLALLLASLALALALPALGFGLRATRDALFRAEVVQAEGLRLMHAEQRLADMQRLTESAVGGSTMVVRAVHKGIASIPFTILESIPATRDTTRVVRITHDLISDAVYGTLGAVNRGVGAKLREGLQSGDTNTPVPSKKVPPS